jgi:hypothetical protein
MTIQVRRNGIHFSRAAHVRVIPCPTGDAVLDDSTVRANAASLWASSNASNPATRIERSMLVFDSLGTNIVRIKPVDPNQDSPCRNQLADFIDSTSVAGASLRAAFHTHPATVGDTINCRDGNIVNGYSDQFGGPSPSDWAVAKSYALRTPSMNPAWYVIDSQNVYRYDASNVDFDLVTQPNGTDIFVPHVPGQTHPWTSSYSKKKRVTSCTLF